MKEINKLDDKYLVLKWTDITESLNKEHTKQLVDIIHEIDTYRLLVHEKSVNKYCVLNLNDDIDLEYLVDTILDKYHKLGIPGLYKIKVEKLAIDLVNAILKTKGE